MHWRFVGAAGALGAQEGQAPTPVADPAELAFEEGRWDDAIGEYREILAAYPEDRLSLLRIAQAQRELKRHDEALATLETARTANAPEAMIDLERARNLALLGRDDEALAALDAADHSGLRALALVESAPEFDRYRERSRFQRVHRNIRARVYPCEGIPEAAAFDFWVGRWEVRMPDGTLIGTNTITKRDGGCSIQERWEGAGGSTGTSVSFYLPSRERVAAGMDRLRRHAIRHHGQGRQRHDAHGRHDRIRRNGSRRGVPRHLDRGRRRPRPPTARGVRPGGADLGGLVRRFLPAARLTFG